jgi:phage/plasmid-associated DNA primase
MKLNQSIIIVGNECSGKTTVARNIASQYGSYTETNINTMMHPFGLRHLINHPVDTLIVEDLKGGEKEVEFVKSLASNDKMKIDIKGHDSQLIDTPNLIFVSRNSTILDMPKNARRFMVIDLDRHGD